MITASINTLKVQESAEKDSFQPLFSLRTLRILNISAMGCSFKMRRRYHSYLETSVFRISDHGR